MPCVARRFAPNNIDLTAHKTVCFERARVSKKKRGLTLLRMVAF